jgi:glutathione synthase
MKALRMAFVMDPLEAIDQEKDTTFVLMLEAQARGHEIVELQPSHLYTKNHTPAAQYRRVRVQRGSPHFQMTGGGEGPLAEFEVVFMRKDPPFDMNYFFSTHLLSLVDPARTFVINDPQGLREANEKLYALHFPRVIPPTLVTQDMPRLKGFLNEVGGEMIIKPLDGCGGAGVFLVMEKDRNLHSIVETSTHFGTRPVMAQRYLPEVRQGDKRVLVLNGEPLGAVLRVPREDEHRGNIHVGGSCVAADITDADRRICLELKPRLIRDGLYFVGLDIIGGMLTEVNVTSPTGVQEINRLSGMRLESQVIDFVEEQVGTRLRSRATFSP